MILLFVSSLSFVYANTKIDSLENLLVSADELTPKELININDVLSKSYLHENTIKSLKYSKEMHRLAEITQNIRIQGVALRKMGFSYQNMRDYEGALLNFIKAETLFKQIEDNKSLGVIYSDIAALFLIKEDDEKGEAYFKKSIVILREANSPAFLSRSLTGLAYIYSLKGDKEKGRSLYKESLEISYELNDIKSLAATYSNLAQTYYDEEDKETVYQLLDSAIYYVTHYPFSSLEQARMFYVYGKAMIVFKDYKDALEYLDKSYHVLSEGSPGEVLINNYKAKATCYKHLNQIDKAIIYLEKYVHLIDSTSNEKSEENYQKFKTMFDTQQKENDLIIKEQELQAFRGKEKASTYKLYLLIALVVILVLTGALFYLNHKNKVERLNHQIKQRDNELKDYALNLIEKNKILKNVRGQIRKIKQNPNSSHQEELGDIPLMILSENPELDERITALERSFFDDLASKYPELTDREKRLCSLIKLDFSSKEIAELLNVSSISIDNYRYKVRKKMKLSSNDSLSGVLNNI